MKKNEALKFLNKFKEIFAENAEALSAINTLVDLSQSLPEGSSRKKISDQDLEIPSEVKGKSPAFLVYGDGACRGNPGPGSWASILQKHDGTILSKSSGVEFQTTNNKMELEAVIKGLNALIDQFIETGHSESDTPVYVFSDSKYVVDGLSSWINNWKSRSWKKADGKEPENVEKWKELDMLLSNFKNINYIWVKGHAGHPQNEMCDQLCNEALDEAGF